MKRHAIVIDIETGEDTAFIEGAREVRYDSMKVDGRITKKETRDTWVSNKLEQQDEKAAISPMLGRVRCIGLGCLVDDESVYVLHARDDLLGEAKTLMQFVRQLPTEAPLFLGWRIRGFDLPFIAFRCAVHGIKLPDWWPLSFKYDRHVAFDASSDFVEHMPGPVNGSGSYKLPAWLHRFGCEAKTGDGGESVGWPLEQVVDYCANDVRVEREMLRRIGYAVPSIHRDRFAPWGDGA